MESENKTYIIEAVTDGIEKLEKAASDMEMCGESKTPEYMELQETIYKLKRIQLQISRL